MEAVHESGAPDPRHPIPFHRQDNDELCGAACAQMIADYHGSYSKDFPQQSRLRNQGFIRENDSWTVSPSELVKMLDKNNIKGYEAFGWESKLSDPIATDFDSFAGKCRDALSTRYNGNLYPPIIAIGAYGHWVVLTSCVYTPSMRAVGFFCNDPNDYFSDSLDSVLHQHNDTCREIDYAENAHLTYQGLYEKATLQSPMKLVCMRPDSTMTKDLPGAPYDIDVAVEETVCGRSKRSLATRNSQLTIPDALDTLANYGISGRPGWKSLLSNAKAGESLMVKIAHNTVQRAFYLIPILDQERRTRVLVQFDAHDHSYWGSLKISSRSLLFRSATGFDALIDDVRIRIHDALKYEGIADATPWIKEFDRQVNSTRSELTWFPCRESLSSFLPFYEVKFSPYSPAVYIRIDGKVFSSIQIDMKERKEWRTNDWRIQP